jgi:hypothetical protein
MVEFGQHKKTSPQALLKAWGDVYTRSFQTFKNRFYAVIPTSCLKVGLKPHLVRLRQNSCVAPPQAD